MQRSSATVIGISASGAGAVAVFRTSNGAGSTALLAVGALFCIIGVLGLVPARFKFGDTEVNLWPTLEQFRGAQVHSDGSSTLETLRDLSVKYETIRATLNAGDQRTVLLEALMLQARSIASDLAVDQYTQRLTNFNKSREGERVMTIALIEGRREFNAEAGAVLIDALKQPKSAFEQYHALLAARDNFSAADERTRQSIKEAARAYLDGPHDPRGDRGMLAQQIRNM